MNLAILQRVCHTLAPTINGEKFMRHLFQILVIGIVFSIFFNFAMTPRKAHAASNYEKSKNTSTLQTKAVSAQLLESNFSRQIRFLRSKWDIEAIAKLIRKIRKHHRNDHHNPTDPPGENPPPTEDPAITKSAQEIVNGLVEAQKQSPKGLIESFSQDTTLDNQAFTYDQALSGIVLLKQGQVEPAKKIFDFYNAAWKDTAFMTVYNSQDSAGPIIETAQTLGATAWMGLFSLHYYKMTGDTKGLELATKIGKWAAESVPHYDGGLAMGDGLSGIWSSIFSTENNLSYYALANGLSKMSVSDSDKALFESEKTGIENWLKIWAYDPNEGLFERGRGDENNAFDTNSWAINVLGVEKLNQLFGIDTDPNNGISSNLVKSIENSFGVQANGQFGGDILTAKGFDFSDAFNAQTVGRTGFKWVEGTQHMILAYNQLADYWKGKNNTTSKYYQDRAQHFMDLNATNAVTQDGQTSYLYTDSIPGTLIFYDINVWRTASGPGAAATSWVYFSLKDSNPFEI